MLSLGEDGGNPVDGKAFAIDANAVTK